MNNRNKFLAIGATTFAVAAGGTGLAVAGSGSDDTGDSEAPITGYALDQAEAAALDHLGEGSVTETEVGDEESYYEVEVTLDDGSETDVQLDRGFNVVGSESDAGEERRLTLPGRRFEVTQRPASGGPLCVVAGIGKLPRSHRHFRCAP